MNSLPLTAPDGTVHAYLCGTCFMVHKSHFHKPGNLPEQKQLDLVRDSAEKCCACRTCGSPVDRDVSPYHCRPHHEVEKAATEARRVHYEEVDKRGTVVYDGAIKNALDRDAAESLRDYMSDLSEEYWCAGWLSDLEYSLWGFVVRGPSDWGLGQIQASEVDKIKRLSDKCGGWWIWDEEVSREIFVTSSEWDVIFASHSQSR